MPFYNSDKKLKNITELRSREVHLHAFGGKITCSQLELKEKAIFGPKI